MSASNCLVITSNTCLVTAGLSPHLGWLFSAPSTQNTPKIPQTAADPPDSPLLDHPINPSLFRAQFPSALVTPTPQENGWSYFPQIFPAVTPKRGFIRTQGSPSPCRWLHLMFKAELQWQDKSEEHPPGADKFSPLFFFFFPLIHNLSWVLFTANPKLWQLNLIKLCFG